MKSNKLGSRSPGMAWVHLQDQYAGSPAQSCLLHMCNHTFGSQMFTQCFRLLIILQGSTCGQEGYDRGVSSPILPHDVLHTLEGHLAHVHSMQLGICMRLSQQCCCVRRQPQGSLCLALGLADVQLQNIQQNWSSSRQCKWHETMLAAASARDRPCF